MNIGQNTQRVLVAFDPGGTTGYAAAKLDVQNNTLELLDMRPIRYPRQDFADTVPGADLHTLFALEVQARIDSVSDAHGVPARVMVENFLGGRGGTVQNSTNQLIGIIVGLFVYGRLQIPVTLQPNFVRNPYLVKARSINEKKGIYSAHSIDALAHLLSAVRQVIGADGMDTLKILPCELR